MYVLLFVAVVSPIYSMYVCVCVCEPMLKRIIHSSTYPELCVVKSLMNVYLKYSIFTI